MSLLLYFMHIVIQCWSVFKIQVFKLLLKILYDVLSIKYFKYFSSIYTLTGI